MNAHRVNAELLDVPGAAERIRGLVLETPLVSFRAPDPRVELRLKLECLQETGAFKARGASLQLALLEDDRRAAGVVATSSGNHGRALAWAAARAGVKATIVMPRDAYPNKIEACRAEGAEVVLAESRAACELLCAELVEAGATLVHPYDDERTIRGAGTVALEIARAWPELELLLVPVGGGGLLAGSCLALAGALDPVPAIRGVEPEGARTLGPALERRAQVPLDPMTSSVQGLCPPSIGARNLEIALRHGVDVITLDDETILAAQRELVRTGGWVVEPAGAAAPAAVLRGHLPESLLEGRSAANPLRVAAIVSGGNPDPAQLASIR